MTGETKEWSLSIQQLINLKTEETLVQRLSTHQLI